MSSASVITEQSTGSIERAASKLYSAPSSIPDVVAFLRAGENCEQSEQWPTESALAHGLTVAICTYKRAQSLVRFLDSLREQEPTPDALIIVDASPDDATERAIKGYEGIAHLAGCVLYFRTTGQTRGLTRQRNFALRWVATDLMAFFDDDIVLLPGCLREMESVCRALDRGIVGVGGFVQNESSEVAMSWRLQRALGMVSSLKPGKYHRSGNITPWSFLHPTDKVVQGDFLPGCAMLWQTNVARQVGFNEAFDRYALGEDLDFSLRAGRQGKLAVAGAARVLHLHEQSGRPDPFRLGYMEVHNRFHIQRRGLRNRTRRDVALFAYSWLMDTLLLARNLLYPSRWGPIVRQVAGRVKAAGDLVRGR
jgi:GT2 family glycosyltransferase